MKLIERIQTITLAFDSTDDRRDTVRQMARDMETMRDILAEAEKLLRGHTDALLQLVQEDGTRETRDAWKSLYAAAVKVQTVVDAL